MCDLHMLCKTGPVFCKVVEETFIFDRLCFGTIQTYVCCLLPAELKFPLKNY